MSAESRPEPDQDPLVVQLTPSHVSVSYLSSLLRVVQAGLREVARSDDGTRRQFDRRPQPMLLLSGVMDDDGLRLHFIFADPSGDVSLTELSSRTFNAFLDRFTEFVRGLPQPGLWGGAALRSPPAPFESELARRMDQVYRELRRSSKASMSFQGRTIEVEGDRLEIV
jgi:hypothetical protein